MLFNSYQFLIFLPIVLLLYYVIPQKFRNLLLLIASYYFYICYDVRYIVLLLAATVMSYFAGILIEKNVGDLEKGTKAAKTVLAVLIVTNILILMAFKYLDFLFTNVNKALSVCHIQYSLPSVSILLPIGISFYLFQTMGYAIDVYRGKKAEHDFINFALFVSFFPQLVAGPIERLENLIPQFREKHKFEFECFVDNLFLMLWGFFLKVVIADRIAIYVDEIYANYNHFNGWYLLVASVLFAFQIYCDFAGYSTIAVGAAGMLGFKLMNNFNSPYCAVDVKDFWARWHISLTGWFRDYLYIPLGGNRKGKVRKYINQMIVFLVSGLWHGAMWNYVIWGGLNGLFIVVSDMIKPIKSSIYNALHIKRKAFTNRLFSAVVTFFLVDFTWIFFRASGTKEAFLILKNMFPLKNVDVLFNGSICAGMDIKNFNFMLLSIFLLIIVDILHNRNVHIREWIKSQNLWFRIFIGIVLVESIIIFGIWGVGYDANSFIYFKF